MASRIYFAYNTIFVTLTWLVLGGNPPARSRRVEQFTADRHLAQATETAHTIVKALLASCAGSGQAKSRTRRRSVISFKTLLLAVKFG